MLPSKAMFRSVVSSTVVVRDHDDEVCFCATFPHNNVDSVLQGEFLALRASIEKVFEIWLTNVLFESDSLQVINELRRDHKSLSKFGGLVYDINIIELSKLFSFSFSHTNRGANGCAYNLVKYAYEFNNYWFWAGVMLSLCGNLNIAH